jgi:hypothetical protein
VKSLENTLPDNTDTRAVLRHLVATLAYRAAKVLRDVPPSFASFQPEPKWRRPVLMVAHLGDLMDWAVRMTQGEYLWRADGTDDWDKEVNRFFHGLAALDRFLASDAPFSLSRTAEILIQGPLADALTHVGQIAMLRSGAGVPVRPGNFAQAKIVIGRVGPDQAPGVGEFDGDASVRRTDQAVS